MRFHKLESRALCLLGWCSVSGAAVVYLQRQKEEKGDRGEGPCPVLSVSCCCCSFLSLPTTRVSKPTQLNHTVTSGNAHVRTCKHTHTHTHTHTHYAHLFYTPRNDSLLPPHFPGEQWLRVRGEKEEKDRTWYSEVKSEENREKSWVV